MDFYKASTGISGFNKIISILGFHFQKYLGRYLKHKESSIIPLQLLKVKATEETGGTGLIN